VGCDLTTRSNNSIPDLGIAARVTVVGRNLDDRRGGETGREERGAFLPDKIAAAAAAVGEDMID